MYVSKRFLYIISFALLFTGQAVIYRAFPSPDYLFSIPGQVLYCVERMGYAALCFLFGAFLLSRLNPSLRPSLWRLLLFSAMGGFFYFIVEYRLMMTVNSIYSSGSQTVFLISLMLYVLLLSTFLSFLYYFVLVLSFPGRKLFCKPGRNILLAYAGLALLIPLAALFDRATMIPGSPVSGRYQAMAELLREMAPFVMLLVTALWLDKGVQAPPVPGQEPAAGNKPAQ